MTECQGKRIENSRLRRENHRVKIVSAKKPYVTPKRLYSPEARAEEREGLLKNDKLPVSSVLR
nr:MAG TPA: hypothetical protein [Caudoviricetes sp.]